MANYLIAFRLNYDSNYSDRWDTVIRAIRAQADGGKTWEEMTSLIVLKSSKDADSLARDIYIGSDFNTTTDSLLVVNTVNNTHATRGQINDPYTLGAFFNTQANALVRALMG